MWDLSGTRQSSEDVDVEQSSSDSYQAVAVLNDRVYVLHNLLGGSQVRVWDLDGTRQASEDVDVGSFNWTGPVCSWG